MLAGQLILQYKRQQRSKLAKIDHYLKNEAGVSYESFRRWFLSKSQQPFSPRVDASPTYFNQLAALEGSIREKFISKRIQDALRQFDRVMVVFGASHLVKQREVLQDAF